MPFNYLDNLNIKIVVDAGPEAPSSSYLIMSAESHGGGGRHSSRHAVEPLLTPPGINGVSNFVVPPFPFLWRFW